MMAQPYATYRNDLELLSRIYSGMTIYDWEDKKVGTVYYVQFPCEQGEQELTESVTRITSLDRAPADMRARLAREGFVQLKRGVFSPMCYIPPFYIHEVGDNHIKLNVNRAALTQF
jgi:hypothetical protein